eukprot:scaffold169591_cov14-Tisochrysis_lutea.AAC.1
MLATADSIRSAETYPLEVLEELLDSRQRGSSFGRAYGPGQHDKCMDKVGAAPFASTCEGHDTGCVPHAYSRSWSFLVRLIDQAKAFPTSFIACSPCSLRDPHWSDFPEG